MTWYPTGPRQTDEVLLRVRSAVLDVARRHGFPRQLANRSSTARDFDREVGQVLIDTMKIEPVDAAQEGVWSFVSLVLLPDVALWRWPNERARDDYERLVGRPRNVFRRLWWRTYVLGEELSSALLEDEAVAIMERPTIGMDLRLSRAVVREHLRVAAERPGQSRQELMRQSAKRIRRLAALVAFTALDDTGLTRLASEVVNASADALTGRSPATAHVPSRCSAS